MPSDMPEIEEISFSIGSVDSSCRCGSLWRLIDQIARPRTATASSSVTLIQLS